MPRWNPILGIWEGQTQNRRTDPPLERGWLKEVLDQASRDVAALPGWVFGGVNPYAPPPPAEPKKE